jgi:hypothetical protein
MKVFLLFSLGDPDPDPYLGLMDPDPDLTCGSGFGSATLLCRMRQSEPRILDPDFSFF